MAVLVDAAPGSAGCGIFGSFYRLAWASRLATLPILTSPSWAQRGKRHTQQNVAKRRQGVMPSRLKYAAVHIRCLIVKATQAA
jgi:hypothetical protein